MPGFCGYVGHDAESKGAQLVDEMCRVLVHTGEQQAVRFKTDELAMAVLARPDILSPLPFVDDGAGMVSLIEGEIYNLSEVIEPLVAQGAAFSGASPAEAVLRTYQRAGKEIGLHLNGAYNAFLWDKSRRKLTIVNDVFGMRPFYYTRIGDGFFFASEVKAFTAVPGFRPSLDYGFVYQFLKYGFPLGERTIAEDVSLLPMATIAEFDARGVKFSPYWGPEHWPEKREMPLEEAIEGFLEVFSRAQARALRGDQEKGILLSGGIDSRIIAAGAVGEGAFLPTFTFGEEGCLDAKIAVKVARELGLSHTFFPIGPEYLTDRSLEVCWLSDGMFNVFHSHGISTYADIARRVKIILSGQEQIAVHLYGDEIRGLPDWDDDLKKPEALFQYMYQEPSIPLTNGSDGLITGSLARNISHEAERVRDMLYGGVVLTPSGAVDPLRTLDWMGLRHRQRRFILMGQLIIRNWLEVRAPLMDSDVMRYTLALQDGFRAEEKPLHIGWLESRAPRLLDVTWQKTGLSIRSSLLGSFLAAGKKWVAQKTGNCIARLAGTPPPWYRKKFADYHMWFVHDESLRRWVRAILLSRRSLDRDFYQPGTVRRLLEEEFCDTAVHTELIGRMVSMELASRLFIDGGDLEEEIR